MSKTLEKKTKEGQVAQGYGWRQRSAGGARVGYRGLAKTGPKGANIAALSLCMYD